MNDPVEVIEPEGINVILTVEQRKDGQYYVRYAGIVDLALMSQVKIQQEYRLEWPQSLIHFGFAAMQLEGL